MNIVKSPHTFYMTVPTHEIDPRGPSGAIFKALDLNSAEITAKTMKRDILNKLGFTSLYMESMVAVRSGMKDSGRGIVTYLQEKIKQGWKTSLRRSHKINSTDGRGNRGTGYPIAHISTLEELADTFGTFDYDDEGRLKKIFLEGKWYPFNEDGDEIYDLFAEPRSERVIIVDEGSDKISDAGKEINCGGGMRLQLHCALPSGGYAVDLSMILGDKSARDMEHNGVKDPVYVKRYFLEPGKDGRLSIRNADLAKDIKAQGKYYGSEILDRLMITLVENHGVSIDQMFDILLSLYPSMDEHSLEVMFGLQFGELNTKIIDIDGFDTRWSWENIDRRDISIMEPEGASTSIDASTAVASLMSAQHVIQRERMGVPNFEYIRQQLIQQYPGNSDWADTVSAIVKNVKANCVFGKAWYTKVEEEWKISPDYSRPLTAAHKLAQFCRNIGLWQPVNIKDVPLPDIALHTVPINNEGLRIITIEVFGYGMSFVVEKDKVKDLSEVGQPNAVFKKVAELTGRQFVPILVSQFHEGD